MEKSIKSKKIAQCTFDGLGEDYRLPEIYYRNYKNIKKLVIKIVCRSTKLSKLMVMNLFLK